MSGESLSERVEEFGPEGCFGLLFGEAIARAADLLREIGAEEEIIWQACKRALAALLTMMNETDHEEGPANSPQRLDEVRKRVADGTGIQ